MNIYRDSGEEKDQERPGRIYIYVYIFTQPLQRKIAWKT
jgi:hypothetical protein